MERARERIRGRIALILITALLVVMGLSFWYILRMSRNLGAVTTDDLITVIQMVGTTLLTPLIGLIGAVTGFYYGGQTAVQAASQGAQTATQAATQAAQAAQTQAAAQAAQAVQAAQRHSDSPTQTAAQEAARAATEAQLVGARSRRPGIVPKR
jgi:pyruvate/2-oxoglutarate dehydrogenase complex dihydrolipoamide acyltransferase (E2) component